MTTQDFETAVLLWADRNMPVEDVAAQASALNASGGVVGVSNVFALGCDLDAAWSGTVALAAELLPGRPLVGYETDPAPASRHGFTPIGPLRVWLKA